MNRLRPCRHFVEAIGVRLVLGLADMAPRTALAFSRLAADAAFRLAPGRRRIACDNLLQAGLVPHRRAAREIVRASFRHFAAMAVESVLVPVRLTASNWRDAVTLEIPAPTLALLEDPARGVLLVSGHFGNWESAGYVVSFLKPVSAVARPMNNPRVQRMIAARSSRARMTVLPKRGASPRDMLKTLQRGNGLAILFDQHAGGNAPWVPFFGRLASTHPSPVRLHWTSGAPIVYVESLRTGFLRYRIGMSAPLDFPRTGHRERDLQQALVALNGRLESSIRRSPGQYLWAHRRWRTPPAAEVAVP